MTEIELTLKDVLEEIKTSKQELKCLIEAIEVRALLKIENLNEKITKLQKENSELQNRLELVDRETRKNNIIVYGHELDPRNISAETVCSKLNAILKTEISSNQINNTYLLGKSSTSPLKVEFLATLVKIKIIKNCHSLRGSSVRITQDFTKQQRENNKILKHHYNQLKNKNEICYIRGGKLIVNNHVYTPEDLLDFENQDNVPQTNSAPATPTVYYHNEVPAQKVEEIEEKFEQHIQKNYLNSKNDKDNHKIAQEANNIPVRHKEDKQKDNENTPKGQNFKKNLRPNVKTRLGSSNNRN